MRVLRFQTRLPTGQVEQLSIESERVLIGSGAHCEIRLPLAEARVEHVLVELGPAGVFARALNFEPPPTINNVPFTQAITSVTRWGSGSKDLVAAMGKAPES